jgi:hypothetical protein
MGNHREPPAVRELELGNACGSLRVDAGCESGSATVSERLVAGFPMKPIAVSPAPSLNMELSSPLARMALTDSPSNAHVSVCPVALSSTRRWTKTAGFTQSIRPGDDWSHPVQQTSRYGRIQDASLDGLIPLWISLLCEAYRKRNPIVLGERTAPKFMQANPGPAPGQVPSVTF